MFSCVGGDNSVTPEDIDFIIRDLRGAMCRIAGTIQVMLRQRNQLILKKSLLGDYGNG